MLRVAAARAAYRGRCIDPLESDEDSEEVDPGPPKFQVEALRENEEVQQWVRPVETGLIQVALEHLGTNSDFFGFVSFVWIQSVGSRVDITPFTKPAGERSLS